MSALPPARCSVYGCRSNPRYGKDVKFFPFPSKDSTLFEKWLDSCKGSAERILSQTEPIICSKHFRKKLIRDEQLIETAVPSRFLKVPPGFKEQGEKEPKKAPKRSTESKERKRLRQLVDDVTFEWVKRAKTHPDMAATYSVPRQLIKIAQRARDLVGATLKFRIRDYFVKRFRTEFLPKLTEEDSIGREDKSLEVKDIVLEFSPYEKIKSEKKIEYFRRMEKLKLMAKRKYERKPRKNIEIKSEDDSMDSSLEDDGGDDSFRDAEQIVKEEIMIDSEPLKTETFEPEEDSSADSSPTNSGLHELHQEIKTEVVDDVQESEQQTKNQIVIDSYLQALKHLKPIEDFALRKENYRVIGALTKIEMLLKNPKDR